MTGLPWFACTTSGARSPETASLSVVLRSVKDFATRLMVTFGYLASNARLRRWICRRWPPRTSWSQTVSVTGPAFATSTTRELRSARRACSALSPPSPPGVPQPASRAVSRAARTINARVIGVQPPVADGGRSGSPRLRPSSISTSRVTAPPVPVCALTERPA
jgi:hypothetical protein